ncbi:hypothetical protein C8J57DRAFT_1167430 [Mycena rebaudengoi]|nr:hypothetical protein C8J57DRAFT_1167430 [Mycena rebaudengoi]
MAGPVRTPPQKKAVQPPRPPNAWILYRSDKSKELGRKAQSDVSKEISALWKNERADIRAWYEKRAEEKKLEHQRMYPDYRFQPVKKEEKDRLREERKKEKEQRKETQRRGRANPQPPAPAPQPSRYAPSAILDPLAPYYQAEQRYGAAGPSPPLSAAASPSDSGSSELSQSRVQESPTSAAAHASPYPQTPSSAYGSPLMPTSSYGAAFTDSQSSQSPPHPSDASHHTGPDMTLWHHSQGEQSNSLVDTGDNWSSGFPSQEQSNAQEYMSFNLPHINTGQSWNGQNSEFDESLQAILSATGDPSIFQLRNFDPQSLLEHPTGQLEISMADLNFPFDEHMRAIPDMSDFHFDLPSLPTRPYTTDVSPHEYGNNSLDALFPNMGSTTSQDFGGNYNADEFLNFDDNSTEASSSRPIITVEHSSPETTRPYVPPAGAAYSSTRRVGASWKPPFPADSPIDQSPTRPSWSVHA